jgi:hypothetical protein
MGYWKDRELEEQERGYGHTEAFGCRDCIGDQALAAVVDEAEHEDGCSYCGKRPTAELDDVIGRAIEGLSIEYRPESSESPPWDNEDHRYIVTPIALAELIRVHMDNDPHQTLWADVESALLDEPWFERDAWAIPRYNVLSARRRPTRRRRRRRRSRRDGHGCHWRGPGRQSEPCRLRTSN